MSSSSLTCFRSSAYCDIWDVCKPPPQEWLPDTDQDAGMLLEGSDGHECPHG
jgi:hypothetical protein